MDSRALNRRVSVQQPTSTQDELGQPIDGWRDVCKVWAEIKYPSGIEAIRGGGDVATLRASVRIRRRQGITTAMRVVDEFGQTFDIKAVLPDEIYREYMFVACEASK